MTNPWIIAGITAAIAALIGFLIGRHLGGNESRQRRLEQQIDELRNESTRYQAKVSEHFMESAQLLRRLNAAHRDINQHLAKGAQGLCHDDEWVNEIEHDQRPRLNRAGTSESGEDTPEPPRDYAPKNAPHEKGTLAEDFGLPEDYSRSAGQQPDPQAP